MTLNEKTASSVTKSTVIVMFALILSKITGQLREMLIPGRIGFGMLSDAFILGFMVPDLIYQLLVGGSIQAAITPALSGAIKNGQEKKIWRSISVFINVTSVLMLVAVFVGELLIPLALPLISGDKSAQTVDLAISVSRVLFPQVFFMMLAALSIGILNAHKKFTVASLGPVVYNLCVVVSMIVFGNKTPDGIVKVAAGVMVSALIYFLMQFYSSRRQFGFYRLSFNIKDEGFRKLVKLAVPTLISASIVQINLIILSAFTNFYDYGSLTSLRFAITTWQLPYGVFAVAIGSVMLPTMAGFYAQKKFRSCSKILTKSLRSALFLTIPSAVIFVSLNREVIRGIFQWGSRNLTSQNIDLTAQMLSWYCIAMVCHTIIFIMNMSFYAMGKTKIPLINGLITLVTNTAFCLVFTRMTPFGVISMPMAYSLSSIISVIVLSVLFVKVEPACAPRKIPQFIIKSFICAFGVFMILLLIEKFSFDSSSKMIQLLLLGTKGLLGFAAYFGIGILLLMKEPLEYSAKIQAKIKMLFSVVGFGRKM
ncbi:MAG: murein biosynthesis integral membrane protein MurJ [Saccharofermentanales bacterium]